MDIGTLTEEIGRDLVHKIAMHDELIDFLHMVALGNTEYERLECIACELLDRYDQGAT
jgi:hypothetical protein